MSCNVCQIASSLSVRSCSVFKSTRSQAAVATWAGIKKPTGAYSSVQRGGFQGLPFSASLPDPAGSLDGSSVTEESGVLFMPPLLGAGLSFLLGVPDFPPPLDDPSALAGSSVTSSILGPASVIVTTQPTQNTKTHNRVTSQRLEPKIHIYTYTSYTLSIQLS